MLGAGKVSADFNGDGFGDLAVLASTIYDEVQDRDPFATVTILYGSADGLTTTGRQRIIGRDMPDAGSQSFAFNPSAVVAGDLNGDGASELVLGWNGAKAGSVPVAGAVYVIPGSPNGLRLGATQVWSQARAGVRGSPEIGDRSVPRWLPPISVVVLKSIWPSGCRGNGSVRRPDTARAWFRCCTGHRGG